MANIQLRGSLGAINDDDVLKAAVNRFKERLKKEPIMGEIIKEEDKRTPLLNTENITHKVLDLFIMNDELVVDIELLPESDNPLSNHLHSFGEEALQPSYRAFKHPALGMEIITIDVGLKE